MGIKTGVEPYMAQSLSKPRSRRSLQRKKNLIAYSFIAPNFIGFAVFTLAPMAFSLVLALMKWNGVGSMQFVGLNNFIRLTKDSAFVKALSNTTVYTLLVVPLTLVAALGLALLLNSNIKGRNFFRTASFFPYVASLVAVATVWRYIFSPTVGTLNMTLSAMLSIPVGELPKWTSQSGPVMFFAVFFTVWKNMGYYMVIYLAGLQGVNTELYEAAALDGANGRQRFFNVTVPQLAPTTFFVLMMLVISSFKVYDVFLNLFAGGDNQLSSVSRVIVYQIYNTAFRNLDYGYASAMAIVLFVIVLSITLVQFRGEKKYAA